MPKAFAKPSPKLWLVPDCLCLFSRSVNRVTFLPQKFHGTKERSRRLLPTHYGAPLVVNLRQVTVGVHDVRIEIAEERLGRRTYTHPFLQRLAAALGYPGNFRSKAFHVILFFIQEAFRDEHRKVAVLNAGFLEAAVKLFLNILPNCVSIWSNYHTSLDAGIIHKFRFLYDVRIPLGEIVLHIGNGLNKIVSHDSVSS